MRSHYRRIPVAALLAVTLTAALPAAALAGSLLSGYGGPGEGNQAILGSALLNGSGHRGGGGGSSGGPSTGGGSTAGGSTAGSTTSSGSGVGAVPAGLASGRSSAKPDTGVRNITGRTGSSKHGSNAQTYTGVTRPASSEASAAGSGTLGLSGADVLYMLLALGALVFTGALTVRLARQPRVGRPVIKAMSTTTRVIR